MYIKPIIISYHKEEILEIIGPTQNASVTIETWRGTKLDNQKPAEYRIAELQENHNMKKIIKLKEDIC